MDEPRHAGLLHGDISAVTQINRASADLRRLLEREDWHGRLMYGSDYPLPGLGWLTSVRWLASAGLLDATDVAPLQALQSLNPLAFDFALKRRLRWQGRRFADGVFAFMPRLRAGDAAAESRG
jgi:mannonate dehydratase